ncbi:MAG: hypothetical protein WAS50_11640, partial [Nitrospira sp.]
RSSVVESLLPKQVVVGSNPIARSKKKPACIQQAVSLPHRFEIWPVVGASQLWSAHFLTG